MTQKELRFLILVMVTFIAAGLETDIYLPAFPDMMRFFHANEAQIQQLLTWNFAGICVAGPLYGPISDAYGRRYPLLVALSLFMAGSILTLFADTFNAMLWGRVLQGVGSGGIFTLGTALIFDAFHNERAVMAINWINSVFPFIMAGAPALGGYLNNTFGFRSNFIAVAALVCVSFTAALMFFRETLPQEKRQPLHLAKLARDYRAVCTSAPFLLLVLAMCLLFSIWMAFLSTVSVLFVLELGVPKDQFPWFQSVPLLSWLVASLTNNGALKRWGPANMKRWGMRLTVLGGLAFCVGTLLGPRNPYLHIATMTLYAFGLNWFQSLYFPAAMELHPDIKGVTASVLTSLRLLVASAMVGITSKMYNATIYPVAVAMAVALIIAVPMVWVYENRQEAEPLAG